MIKKLSILLTFLLILPLTNAAYVPIIDLTLTNQNPYPVEPGQNVAIEIEIQNSGLESAQKYIIIDPKPPFELLPGEERTKFFTIEAKSSVKTSYNLHVDSNATSGEYELEFKIASDLESKIFVTKKVKIRIQGTPDLILNSQLEGIAQPGSKLKLFLKVCNVGTGNARQSKLELTGNDYVTPILSEGLIYFGSLAPNECKNSSLTLSISTDAEHKVYTINANAEYYDESNDQGSQQFDIGIPVTGSINLAVIKVEAVEERGKMRIEVANTGTVEAKSLTAKLFVNNELIGTDYASNLKANKKTTFTFPLVYEGKGYITISYIDAELKRKNFTQEVVLSFEKPKENLSYVYVLIIAVIIIAFFILKKKLK